MNTPFPDFGWNTVLVFAVPTGALTQDELGHTTPKINRIKVMATLKVKPLTFAHSKRQRPPGIDEHALLLEGYCLEPAELPHSILPQSWAQATWSGQPGYFYLTDPLNPPYGREGLGSLLEASAGTKMMGWFQTSRAEYAEARR